MNTRRRAAGICNQLMLLLRSSDCACTDEASQLLDELEQNTLPTVSYDSFSLTPDRQVALAVTADSLDSAAQQMVAFHLGLSQIPQPNDAADALAVAICHLREAHVRELLARQSGESA